MSILAAMKSARQLAWIVVALGCASAEPAAPIVEETHSQGGEDPELAYVYGPPLTFAQTTPRPPPARVPAETPLPAARSDAAALAPEPALVAGDAAFGHALALPLGVTEPEPTLQGSVARWVECFGAVSAALVEMNRAYERDATTPALVALSLVRRGDAHDLVATRLLEAPFVLPASLGGTSRPVPAQVDHRIRQAFRGQAQRLFCVAAGYYRGALEGELPSAVRARAQLAAYGDDFLASCPEASAP